MDKQTEIEMDIIRRKWKRSYYKYSGQDNLERREKENAMDVREEELQHTNWLNVSQERQERERKGIDTPEMFSVGDWRRG